MRFFLSGTFRPGTFRPGIFPPRLFVPLRPFCPACLPLPEGGGCSSGKVRRTSGKGRSLGRKEERARQLRDGVTDGGGHPAAGTALRGEFPAERVPAGPEWRSDNTNRIKNTRFGLPFNEKFGMFVHMNRIRLAEVTLIGHATGSLSGPCAGRGTGGENIWCFMSPAR